MTAQLQRVADNRMYAIFVLIHHIMPYAITFMRNDR